MKVIRPTTPTDAMVTANNIAGSTYSEWSLSTPYTANQNVKIESIHREYRCLIANTGEDPTENTVDTNGNPYWLDLGSTNDWALFDGRSRKASVNPNNITVSIKPNSLVNGLALLNIRCGDLNITAVSDSAGVVYNKDIQIRSYVSSFYEWFFSPITNIENIVRIDLPAYSDLTITITMNGDGDVELGEFIFGRIFEIGQTEYGVSLGIRDFSTKEFDTFGNAFVIERGFSNRIEYPVAVNANRTAVTRNFLAQYRATPLVYIGNEDYPETITYGFYKSFNEVMSNFSVTDLVLEVEELS